MALFEIGENTAERLKSINPHIFRQTHKAMKTWYYTIRGEQQGPISQEELTELARSGALRREDLVWSEGMPDWTPSASIPTLPGSQEASDTESPGAVGPPALPRTNIDAQELLSGETPTSRSEAAGFWLRAAAILVDSVLFLIASIVLGAVLGVISGLAGTTTAVDDGILGIFNVFIVVAAWLYFAGMESSSYQATLGKRLLGLKVTDLNGDPIGFGQATGRHFGKIVSGLLTLFIGYAIAGFTEKKQALHDLMAGCIVVKKREEESSPLL